jgi:hypothetical protein
MLEQSVLSAIGEHTSAVPAAVVITAVVAYPSAKEVSVAVAVKVLPAAVDPTTNWHLPSSAIG